MGKYSLRLAVLFNQNEGLTTADKNFQFKTKYYDGRNKSRLGNGIRLGLDYRPCRTCCYYLAGGKSYKSEQQSKVIYMDPL